MEPESETQSPTRLAPLEDRNRRDPAALCGLCEAYVLKYNCHLLDPPPANCPAMARMSAGVL